MPYMAVLRGCGSHLAVDEAKGRGQLHFLEAHRKFWEAIHGELQEREEK